MNDMPLRVLVVDDAIFYRKVVKDILAELPDVMVVGTAGNGKIATARIASLKPDILILDIEMPEMDGLEVLAWMKEHCPEVGAIVLSGFTQEGGDLTIRALELGAFDFIPKVEGGSMEESRSAIKSTLISMLKSFARKKDIRSILRGKPVPSRDIEKEKTGLDSEDVVQRMRMVTDQERMRSEIVGIGVSTGGPNALGQVLSEIPGNLNTPILIVQHMPPVFTRSLAKSLDSKCKIDVREAIDGESIQPHVALIAPGGKQMKVAAAENGKGRIVRITDDPPENSCKPSVDYLLRSIAHIYRGRATGVIMTGMGNDGILGLKLMKRNGAVIIAQDEATCTIFGMPKEPIESGIVDVVAPLDKIAEEICRTVRSSFIDVRGLPEMTPK